MATLGMSRIKLWNDAGDEHLLAPDTRDAFRTREMYERKGWRMNTDDAGENIRMGYVMAYQCARRLEVVPKQTAFEDFTAEWALEMVTELEVVPTNPAPPGDS